MDKNSKYIESKENKNLKQLLLSLLQAIVTLVVGLYFYSSGKSDIGIILSVIGGYLILNRLISQYMIEETFKKTENQITQIAKIADIRNNSNVELISEVLDIYLKITEPEFSNVKSRIISDSIDKLNKLYNDKHSDELATYDYYYWLLPILDKVSSGQTIKALSCMFDTEWDESPQETKFIQGNLNAAKKGATVERIFVMDSTLLNSALEKEPIIKHTFEKRSEFGLYGYFVDNAKLDSELKEIIGSGFIIFDSRFALIDKFDAQGTARGVVTMNHYEIKRMEEAFEKLKNISQDLKLSMKKSSDFSQNRNNTTINT